MTIREQRFLRANVCFSPSLWSPSDCERNLFDRRAASRTFAQSTYGATEAEQEPFFRWRTPAVCEAALDLVALYVGRGGEEEQKWIGSNSLA